MNLHVSRRIALVVPCTRRLADGPAVLTYSETTTLPRNRTTVPQPSLRSRRVTRRAGIDPTDFRSDADVDGCRAEPEIRDTDRNTGGVRLRIAAGRACGPISACQRCKKQGS